MTTDAPLTTLAAFLLARYDETEAAVKEHSEPWPLAGAYSWIRNEINDYDLHGEIADHTGIEWEVPGWLGRSDGGSRRAARGTWALAQGR